MKKLLIMMGIATSLSLISCANKGYECECVDNNGKKTVYHISANSRDIASMDCLGRNDLTRSCTLQ